MQGNKNKITGFTTNALKVLLGFSFVATIIAFAVAFCEHRQYTELVEKYDDALVRISQCEASVSQLMNETSYYNSIENSVTYPSEYTTEEYQEQTKSNITSTAVQELDENTQSEKPDTTKETTTKIKETSGTYYVTQSGKKYHVASCSYLKKSKIAITMDRIKAEGYSPCSRCIK